MLPNESGKSGISLFLNTKGLEGIRYGPDSIYISGFLSQVGMDAKQLFSELMEIGPFVPRDSEVMLYRGNQLARTKFFLVEDSTKSASKDQPPKMIRKYVYPGWQWESLMFYRSIDCVKPISDLVKVFHEQITYSFSDHPIEGEDERKRSVVNHVIGTKYISGEDNIGWHNDKTKDITPNSLIYIISLGERRELHLR
eukprot:TRINITY_DN679_c0_g1_i3.p1 TRINITY_DN679_c0_g1~~TRINITY_DN679_c0_g1_i3.p1  ORF type:complete len:213 (+),score=43.64 TRINITY_DN679_c0_g1_i3:50-640(+)